MGWKITERGIKEDTRLENKTNENTITDKEDAMFSIVSHVYLTGIISKQDCMEQSKDSTAIDKDKELEILSSQWDKAIKLGFIKGYDEKDED